MNRIFVSVTAIMLACSPARETKTIGSIERIDPALNSIIGEGARIEVLAEGYEWSEGPVWVESQKMLLFSDVPRNTVYKWTEENGAEQYLTPSGYTGTEPYETAEPGSNGLTLDPLGNLVLCQHGDRRVARLDAPLDQPKPQFVSLAAHYDGKRFNSPNDVVFRSNGDFFFTDPPYGLPGRERDTVYKELAFHGVYKVSGDGQVTLLVDSVSRPNGVALTADGRTLLVANSDPRKPVWYAFDLTDNDSATNARIFYDASGAKGEPGLPDGLKIDKQGNVFASGPGGIWVFDKNAKLLGKIKVPAATANCALADDDRTLYLTSDTYLLRVRLR